MQAFRTIDLNLRGALRQILPMRQLLLHANQILPTGQVRLSCRKRLFFSMIIAILFCSSFGFAEDVQTTMNQEREEQKRHYFSSFNKIQSCSESVQSLSDRVSALEQGLANKRSFYRNISTEEDFQKALGLRKKAQADIQALKRDTRSLKRKCPVFDSEPIMNQLDLSIKALKDDLKSMRYDKGWMETSQQISQKVYNQHKLGHCDLDIYGPSAGVINEFYNTQMAYSMGDIFKVNQGLSTLTVLNDYISATTKACGLESAIKNINDPAISDTKRAITKAEIKSLQYSLNTSQKMLEDAKAKFGGLDFKETSEKICQKLIEQTKDQGGICENPVDNPSWHYSASYFLNQTNVGKAGLAPQAKSQ